MSQPRLKVLLSDEHFSVESTLIEAWASTTSFKPKGDTDGSGAGAEGEPPTEGRRPQF